MIRLGNKEYSGNIARNTDSELIVLIYSSDAFNDVISGTEKLNKVIEIGSDGAETVIEVSNATRASMVQNGIYSISFSKQLPLQQKLMKMIEEQNEIIDSLLVMNLER